MRLSFDETPRALASANIRYHTACTSEAPGSPKVFSAAFVSEDCDSWIYFEVRRAPASVAGEEVPARDQPKLAKVPHTQFVMPNVLGPAMEQWLAADLHARKAPGATLVFRDRHAAASLRPHLEGETAAPLQLCEFAVDHASMLEHCYQHSGGADKACNHALVDAAAMAVLDINRMRAYSGGLHASDPFGLLLGPKGAGGFRAWSKRLEALRLQAICQIPADGQGFEYDPEVRHWLLQLGSSPSVGVLRAIARNELEAESRFASTF